MRHLARTNLLLHLVDIAPFDPEADPVREAKAIVAELEKYDPELAAKPRWLVINKIDLLQDDEREARIEAFLDAYGRPERWFAISAIKKENLQPLIHAIQAHLDEHPRPEDEPEEELDLTPVGPTPEEVIAAELAKQEGGEEEEDGDDENA